jgi:hypothetical protein
MEVLGLFLCWALVISLICTEYIYTQKKFRWNITSWPYMYSSVLSTAGLFPTFELHIGRGKN